MIMKLLPSLRSCSNIRDVYVKTRVLQRETELNRLRILKARKGITYAQLAQELGCNKIWIASVFCGQNPCDYKTVQKLSELLDDKEKISHIIQIPIRGNRELISDPVVYRLQELVFVYGSSIREVIHEEFGDGIMSAIDCKLDIQRKETEKGPRIVLTIDGKFLPYYDGSEEEDRHKEKL